MNNEYKKMLDEARRGNYIIGAFNVFNHLSAKAVAKAAEELNSPVILEMSTSVVKALGISHALNMLNMVKNEAKVPIMIHLDHCLEPDIAIQCIKNGWKSIMFDGSKLTLEENIVETKKLVEYAKKYDVHIEGEVGVIKGVEDGVVSDFMKLASFEETMHYIEQTGVNTIAPAIGTAHGLYSGAPSIKFDLIKELADESSCPVVIHGGTGLSADDYKKLIECGAAKLNISTAIKHAYIDGIIEYAKQEPTEYEPLKADEVISNSIVDVAKKHILMFNQIKK